MIKYILAILLTVTPCFAAIEDLDQLDLRKARKATNAYYSGESAGNGWNRQSESLMYTDSRTGHEVWVLSNTPNKSNIFSTDISPANPWSADGARLGFFSNRAVTEFNRTGGSTLDGAGGGSTFTVKADGSHLRAAYDSAERTWGSNGGLYFYWSPVVPDTYYTTGGRANGLSLDASGIYKNVVSDTATVYNKLVDLPGTDSDYYGMKKVISPDGKYLLPKKDGKYFPVRVYPDVEAGLPDADGFLEYRGQQYEWAADTQTVDGCRHDIAFPSPNYYIVLFSNYECSGIGSQVWKFNLGGTDTDGGPDFVSSATYPSFGDFEAEPLWTWGKNPTVPWKIQYPTAILSHGWGHPGFDRWGRNVAYGDGNAYWATNGGPPLVESGGPIVWDYKNRLLVADPTETVNPIVHYEGKTSYHDWNAWSDHFAGANNSSTTPATNSAILSIEYNKIADAGNDTVLAAYHYGNQNGSTSYSYTSNARIAQSPDGTKIAYNVTLFSSIANTGELAYAVAYYPHPPEITGVTNNAGTYTIRFDWRLGAATPRGYTKRGWPNEATNQPPPPRETKLFRLWRSATGVDNWQPAGTVNANIFSRYDFSTGDWAGNDYWTINDTPGAGTWYYAVTALEQSGIESRVLSNVFSTAGTQTVAYPSNPKSKVGFTTTYQSSLVRHYNIYAKDGTLPDTSTTDAQRRQIVATIPAGYSSYVDSWGNITGNTKYVVRALDTQGNVSEPLVTAFTMRGVAGQYDISWTTEAAPAPTCTTTLTLCPTESDCTAIGGGYWWGATCHATAEPPVRAAGSILTNITGHPFIFPDGKGRRRAVQ